MDFDHFNILRLIGVCFDTRSNLPAIVLPYMAKGDLRTFLRAKRASMISSDAPKDEYPEVCEGGGVTVYDTKPPMDGVSFFLLFSLAGLI